MNLSISFFVRSTMMNFNEKAPFRRPNMSFGNMLQSYKCSCKLWISMGKLNPD
ncbi:hypothetical protein ACE6H2_008634 [Prunus campanulata]